MKKTVISVFALGVAALVLGEQTGYAEETTVEYSVEGEYMLVIPQKVTLNSDAATEMSIKTVNRNLEPGKEVEVSLTNGLSTDGKIELKRVSSTESLTSSIKVAGADVTTTNNVIGSFTGYEPAEKEISKIEFGAPQGQKLAGAYQTTLTFNAGYK